MLVRMSGTSSQAKVAYRTLYSSAIWLASAVDCHCSCLTGSALTAIVAARVPPGAAISPLAGPPDLEDALDAQRDKVRMVSSP